MGRVVAGTKRARQVQAENSKRGILEKQLGETPQQREIRQWNDEVERLRREKSK